MTAKRMPYHALTVALGVAVVSGCVGQAVEDGPAPNPDGLSASMSEESIEAVQSALIDGYPADDPYLVDLFGLVTMVVVVDPEGPLLLPYCSGVALDETTFITSAHCPDPDMINFHQDVYEVAATFNAPGWQPDEQGRADFKIGFLEEPLVSSSGSVWTPSAAWAGQQGAEFHDVPINCAGRGSGSYMWADFEGAIFTPDSDPDDRWAGTLAIEDLSGAQTQGNDSGGPCFTADGSLMGLIKGSGGPPSAEFLDLVQVTPFDIALQSWATNVWWQWQLGLL